MHRTTPTRSEAERRLLDSAIPIREIVRPCLTVRSGTGVQHARLEMLEREAEEICVVDVEGRPVGLVHGDDLLHDALEQETPPPHSSRMRAAREPFDLDTDSGDEVGAEALGAEAPLVVDDVLSTEFATLTETDSIREAATAMKRTRCEAVLVTDGNKRLLGIVTAADIVAWVGNAKPERRSKRRAADPGIS